MSAAGISQRWTRGWGWGSKKTMGSLASWATHLTTLGGHSMHLPLCTRGLTVYPLRECLACTTAWEILLPFVDSRGCQCPRKSTCTLLKPTAQGLKSMDNPRQYGSVCTLALAPATLWHWTSYSKSLHLSECSIDSPPCPACGRLTHLIHLKQVCALSRHIPHIGRMGVERELNWISEFTWALNIEISGWIWMDKDTVSNTALL